MLPFLLLAIHISKSLLHDDAALGHRTDHPIVLADSRTPPNGISMPFRSLYHCRVSVGPPYNGNQIEFRQRHAL